MQVLDHPAVVGDHPSAGTGLPGREQPARVLDRSGARRERRVARLDLAGVDEGLAVEPELTTLVALDG